MVISEMLALDVRFPRHQEIDAARRTAASGGTCREICR
jgi:hypothetical protein